MTTIRKKILLTNDDGIRSNGILTLYTELSKFADVTIIAAETQRSAESKAITINNIIRTEKINITESIVGYSISGTTADAVILGTNILEEGPFDFVVSGINQGLNISNHIVLTSGTCAACFEASFYNIPAVAFSMHVSEKNFFVSPDHNTFQKAAEVSAQIVKELLLSTYPENLAFINVNYPQDVSLETEKRNSFMANKFLDFKPEERQDPRNNNYYFIWGDIVKDIPPGSDTDTLMQKKVSISAVTANLNLNVKSENEQFVDDLIQKVK